MAAPKKRKRTTTATVSSTASRQKHAPAAVAAAEKEASIEAAGPFSIKAYVIMNVIFDGFCVLQLLLARIFIHETRGLYFFFCLLMIGFLAVSAFDFLYDRFVQSPDDASVI
jgi:hypothetical protein